MFIGRLAKALGLLSDKVRWACCACCGQVSAAALRCNLHTDGGAAAQTWQKIITGARLSQPPHPSIHPFRLAPASF
jgi:hypothetical protein